MDATFSNFVEFLKTKGEEIRGDLIIEKEDARNLLTPAFRELYTRWDHPGTTFSKVAATDSSEFVRELYNGKKIILARAYTIFNEKLESTFFSDVIWVARDDLRPFVSLLMEDCEHRSTIDVIKNERPEICFIDGSLTGRIMHNLRKLNVENHDSFATQYAENLKELLGASVNEETTVVFLSKSSESRTLMRKVTEALKVDRETFSYVDQVLIRSLAEYPGYTTPMKFELPSPYSIDNLSVWSFHVVPSIHDLPLKVDIIVRGNDYDESVFRKVLDTVFWGYTGLKVHNLWISKADSMVKFRNEEMERIYMRHFEKAIGVDFPETRGERRARIRI